MTDERIQGNFWLSEFIRSDTAQRHNVDNTPGVVALANIRNILAPGMQRVRSSLGVPVLITSGYRSARVNALVGSGNASQHLQGLAADFVAPDFGTPRVVARYLIERSGEIRFDQLIWEGGWVHISFAAAAARNEALTAHFMNSGGVSYSRGVA